MKTTEVFSSFLMETSRVLVSFSRWYLSKHRYMTKYHGHAVFGPEAVNPYFCILYLSRDDQIHSWYFTKEYFNDVFERYLEEAL